MESSWPSVNAMVALGIDPMHPFANVGVKFIVEPYAQFDGKFRGLNDWSIETKAAVEGSVAPFGDFLGQAVEHNIEFTLFDFELARGPTTSATP